MVVAGVGVMGLFVVMVVVVVSPDGTSAIGDGAIVSVLLLLDFVLCYTVWRR